jgi:hypothetical protein
MSFLSNTHLDLTTSCIENERCILIPYMLRNIPDIHELMYEFYRATEDLSDSSTLPDYDGEKRAIKRVEDGIKNSQLFELLILEKTTGNLL